METARRLMGSPHILLIDDEAALLRLMETFLVRHGYRVTTCGDAPAATQVIGDPANGIQLAIADLSLMNGTDTLLELAALDPSLKILVCSGLPFEVAVLPENLRPRFASLQKPFLPNMLAAAVEQLLGR